MAHRTGDSILEISTTTGTGAITLGGAVTGYKAFSSLLSVSDTCWYSIRGVDANGVPTGEWEVGLGTYSGVNTLTRTTVVSSSNSNAVVSLSAGSKQVCVTLIASKTPQLNSTNTLVLQAPTTTNPSLNLPHGTAPTTPIDGDVWTTTAGIYVRINGSTVGPLSAGGGGGGTGATTGFGSINIDFGSGTGSNEASVTVTGQTLISGSSVAVAAVNADGVTSNHSASDHKYISVFIGLTCGASTAGSGFTIYARSIHKLTGLVSLDYWWSN